MEKKSIFYKSSSELFSEIENQTNEVGHQAFDLSKEREIKVQLIPNFKVERGLFIPDHNRPGTYYAHPFTIKAVRKDIFVTDNDLSDFSEMYKCESCRKELDLQFWSCCPYCEAKIYR